MGEGMFYSSGAFWVYTLLVMVTQSILYEGTAYSLKVCVHQNSHWNVSTMAMVLGHGFWGGD